jgi:hypothetical protein
VLRVLRTGKLNDGSPTKKKALADLLGMKVSELRELERGVKRIAGSVPGQVERQAELHKRTVESAREMTPEEGFEFLVKAGIYTPEGDLAPEYGGPRRK